MWQVVVAFLAGLGVAEYYNRFRIDRIRCEQLEELRAERQARGRAAEPAGGVVIRSQKRMIPNDGGVR